MAPIQPVPTSHPRPAPVASIQETQVFPPAMQAATGPGVRGAVRGSGTGGHSRGSGPSGPSRGPGSARGRVIAAAATVVTVIGLSAAGIAALKARDDRLKTAGSTPTGSVSPTVKAAVPADEQCTDEIMANERWVCLTSAKFKGDTLTIRYKADFAGDEPNVRGGYHLHIYGGDGVTPAAEAEGLQAMHQGTWYVEDQKPSVRTFDSKDYQKAIGDAPKVCARIAFSGHLLVQDKNGTYATGNCVPIDRTGLSTARKTTVTSGGGNSGNSGNSTATTSPTPTPTPTDTPTSTWTPSAFTAETPS